MSNTIITKNDKIEHLLQMSQYLLTQYLNQTNDFEDELQTEIYLQLITDFLENN